MTTLQLIPDRTGTTFRLLDILEALHLATLEGVEELLASMLSHHEPSSMPSYRAPIPCVDVWASHALQLVSSSSQL
jgi:hypothetical protein